MNKCFNSNFNTLLYTKDGIGEAVRDLINNMLQSDPDIRFSSEDILDHYWLMSKKDFEHYL